MADDNERSVHIDSPEAYINRELSWLSFARRVLELAQDPGMPLLERVKFAGIMGMLYDEFAMKRLGGLQRQIEKKPEKISSDGRTPLEELQLCRKELLHQTRITSDLIENELRPALAEEGIPIYSYDQLTLDQQQCLKHYFIESILPILTPLAVDVGHPFPFISNLGLNFAVVVIDKTTGKKRFVRIKMPTNRNRLVAVPDKKGWVLLEDVIAANLQELFPAGDILKPFLFRVTRAAKDNPWERAGSIEDIELEPGAIIGMVTTELSFRKFAGIVRLETSGDMPAELQNWLAEQLHVQQDLIVPVRGILGFSDLLNLKIEDRPDLKQPSHEPAHHPRFGELKDCGTDRFFKEIQTGDILVHLPYHNFDSSVLRFLQCAAIDPKVLAIKLTIYRTASHSEIIQALMDAAELGKQVAVMVEITARFDEAPNIEWGRKLEKAGAHVIYGMERLKTHVKLAMVVREEEDGIRRYVHIGTGNYHAGTARLYTDLGLLSSDKELGENVSSLFNELTGAIKQRQYDLLLVAPHNMRQRFTELIRDEIEHRKAGKPAGIRAKLNQLQDPEIIKELYLASRAGVPVILNVRGICCLRAGVPGLSENIRVFCILGQFLEHSRIYRFENGGDPLFFIGSADWMRRNLDRRMEAITPVFAQKIKEELEAILTTYENDNTNAWEMQQDGSYIRRVPAEGDIPLTAQDYFTARAASQERKEP